MDDNLFGSYEAIEFKLNNDNDSYMSSRSKVYQTNQRKQLSPNGLHYHETNGSKALELKLHY